MKIEVYLSKGEKEGMFKAELYTDGINPSEAYPTEFSQEKIPQLINNFYEGLEMGGVTNIEVELRNRGLEDRVYEDIKNQVSLVLKPRKARLN